MADHPLRSATDRRLGEPLPHQQANQTQVHPVPKKLWPVLHVQIRHYEVLITVSSGYPSVRGRLPTRYSPVRRYRLRLSTEVSIRSFPLDLHVLGTPPAFILSQDQTLKLWYITRLSTNNIWLKRTHLRFAVIVVFQRNCTRTLKHRLIVLTNHCWLYFVHLNLIEAFASIEKNSIFSFDSISTLCSFQCARARFRFALVPFEAERLLFYLIRFRLSRTFFKFLQRSISSEAPSSLTAFIFYQTFQSLSTAFFIFFDVVRGTVLLSESSSAFDAAVMFGLEADARTARKRSCDTAFLIYQTGFHLSTPFSLIFWSFFFLCDSFRQFLECLKFPAFSAFRTYLILSKISFVFTSELIENSSIFSPHHLLFSEN